MSALGQSDFGSTRGTDIVRQLRQLRGVATNGKTQSASLHSLLQIQNAQSKRNSRKAAAAGLWQADKRRYRLFRGFKRQTSNTACGLPLASHQPLHSAWLGAVVWPWG